MSMIEEGNGSWEVLKMSQKVPGKQESEHVSRRQFLFTAGQGAGAIALAGLREETGASAFRNPHFQPRAKNVIWLFMHGGPSHVDLFDPKPELIRYSGQPVPDSFGEVMTRRDVGKNPLLAPVKPFFPRGESGLEISDFLPRISECADDLCVIRSMHGDSVNHPQSVYQMNTGTTLMGNPSVGSWLAYGLGSENSNMPAFVVLPDPGGGLKGGPSAWGNGYLPASYQGVTMRPGKTPILDLQTPAGITFEQQERNISLLRSLNHQFFNDSERDDELGARIAAYELAFRMQMEAPGIVSLDQESQYTQQLYGLENPQTFEFGRRCLLARRLVEQGVRIVQVYSGDTGGWDAHRNVLDNHGKYCRRTDAPVAGLLKDLRQRGLLDHTLVIWGGEFGRMPMSEQGKGRDHNPWGYSCWMAGAGIRGGRAIGATDPIGLRAMENKVHVRDFHATILHLLGIDYRRLSFRHNGLEKRLTGPDRARVVREMLI